MIFTKTRIQQLHDSIVLGIKKFFRDAGFNKAVIGLSGGIDSAVTCSLVVKALGKKNVVGVLMPGPYSSKGSIDDAEDLARRLGISIRFHPITFLYDNYKDTLGLRGEEGKAEQNIQARIRATLLMAIANNEKRLLVATGNKSELMTGYFTLYGDGAGALAPIGDVYKTTVYKLARHINRNKEKIPKAILRKAPSAELAPGQKDTDTLPPYDVLDKVLYNFSKGVVVRDVDPKIVRQVLDLVKASEFKRKMNPVVLKVSKK